MAVTEWVVAITYPFSSSSSLPPTMGWSIAIKMLEIVLKKEQIRSTTTITTTTTTNQSWIKIKCSMFANAHNPKHARRHTHTHPYSPIHIIFRLLWTKSLYERLENITNASIRNKYHRRHNRPHDDSSKGCKGANTHTHIHTYTRACMRKFPFGFSHGFHFLVNSRRIWLINFDQFFFFPKKNCSSFLNIFQTKKIEQVKKL